MGTSRIPGTFGIIPPNLAELADIGGFFQVRGAGQKPVPANTVPAAPADNVELTILARYANPWETQPQVEARLSRQKEPGPHWSPATDTFEAVAKAEPNAGRIRTCGTLEEILNNINVFAGDSVIRVNIIAHGRSDGFAIKGTIKGSAGSTTDNPPVPFVAGDTFLDEFVNIAALTTKTPGLVAKRDRARLRFKKGARVVLYACDSAIDKKYLKAVAMFFGVKASGFDAQVGYFPQLDRQITHITDRSRTGMLDASGNVDPLFTIIQPGFKHLDSNGASKILSEDP